MTGLDLLDRAVEATGDPFDDDPSAPHKFRTTFRRQRWYIDPLPACDLAEATDERWPALSTVKRAWSSHFTKRWDDGNVYDLDPLRVARYADENWAELANMDSAERIPALALSAKADLNAAAQRGTGVHSAIEHLMAGDEQAAVTVCPPAYWATVQRIIADLNPTALYTERVAIDRGLGLAGTFDIILETADGVFIVDWKSRGADSSHGAYEGEIAQLGGYARADYLIDTVDGAPCRRPIPELTGGLIVSIKPDSYALFPVDLGHAKTTVEALHATWKLISTGKAASRKATGKPVTVDTTETEAPVRADTDTELTQDLDPNQDAIENVQDFGEYPAPLAELLPEAVHQMRTTWIQQRIATLATSPAARQLVAEGWPATGAPVTAPWTAEQIDALVVLLTHVESLVEAPFPADDPGKPSPTVQLLEAKQAEREAAKTATTTATTPEPYPTDWPTPDEGSDADPVAVIDLVTLARALPAKQQKTLKAWTQDTHKSNRSYGRADGGTWSERCLAVNTAIYAALTGLWDDDPADHHDLVHAAIEHATGRTLASTHLVGPTMAGLTISEATRLTETATAFAAGDPTVSAALVERILNRDNDSNTSQSVGDVAVASI